LRLLEKQYVSKNAHFSGQTKKICGNLSHLWMPARSLRSKKVPAENSWEPWFLTIRPLFAAPAEISRRGPSFSFLAGLMWMQ
jgi:hypothetical protein